jgi:hypothetical protein
MTDDRTLERAARSWLEEGPTRAPDRPVEAALSRIQTTRQERDLRIPWRFPTMNPIIRIAAVALVAVVALGGIYLAFKPTSDVGPSTPTGQPPSATATPVMIGPIRAGLYDGPVHQVADVEAQLRADTRLSAAERGQIIDVYMAAKGKRTWRGSLELRNGQMTQRQVVDGDSEIGTLGTYAFPDDHTLVFTESDTGLVTAFELTVDGDTFTLHRTTAADNAVDDFILTLIFESGPFVLR